MTHTDPIPGELTLAFRLAAHDARRARTETLDLAIAPGADTRADFAGASWRLRLDQTEISPGVRSLRFSATVERGQARSVSAGLVFSCLLWSPENYVLIPGAVYAGNRFDAQRRPYPPVVRDVGQHAARLILDIGDIPRLSATPGPSHLDQTTLDASTPALGVRFADSATGLLLLAPRTNDAGHAIGLEVVESPTRDSAELVLLCPGFLHPLPDEDAEPAIGNLAGAHRHPENPRPPDLAVGDTLAFTIECHVFPCADVHALFARLFAYRTALFPETATPPPEVLPFSAAWDLLEQKHNAANWNEAAGLYQVGIPWDARPDSDQAAQFWQNGWCGGGITSFALAHSGKPRSQDRAARNLDFVLREGLAPTGFFKACMGPDGVWKGDGFGVGGVGSPLSLTRRQGDTLLFVLRQLSLSQDDDSPGHLRAARRCAAALCDLWEREGEFGFLIDYESARVAVRGSTSGALIPAALVLAAHTFDEPRFLRVALAAAAHYRDHDLAWGVTTGGPGDAAQAPDCESIFGLVESFIALHEATGDPV